MDGCEVSQSESVGDFKFQWRENGIGDGIALDLEGWCPSSLHTHGPFDSCKMYINPSFFLFLTQHSLT